MLASLKRESVTNMKSFRPNFAMLWVRLVATVSALLGIPDFVLQAAAQWILVACNLVFVGLNLFE